MAELEKQVLVETFRAARPSHSGRTRSRGTGPEDGDECSAWCRERPQLLGGCVQNSTDQARGWTEPAPRASSSRRTRWRRSSTAWTCRRPRRPRTTWPAHPEDYERGVEEDEEPVEESLSPEDPVRLYLREIGRIHLLNSEQEVRLGQQIERGQERVRRAIMAVPWSGRSSWTWPSGCGSTRSTPISTWRRWTAPS